MHLVVCFGVEFMLRRCLPSEGTGCYTPSSAMGVDEYGIEGSKLVEACSPSRFPLAALFGVPHQRFHRWAASKFAFWQMNHPPLPLRAHSCWLEVLQTSQPFAKAEGTSLCQCRLFPTLLLELHHHSPWFKNWGTRFKIVPRFPFAMWSMKCLLRGHLLWRDRLSALGRSPPRCPSLWHQWSCWCS